MVPYFVKNSMAEQIMCGPGRVTTWDLEFHISPGFLVAYLRVADK